MIRARDLGNRMILLGTEQGVDPPLCLVGTEYEQWKGREDELEIALSQARQGGKPPLGVR